MQKLIVSAPFGEWFRIEGATSTLGTYTYECRAGWLLRWWRMLTTVWYYPGIQAWKNKLGLPSPGIGYLSARYLAGEVVTNDKIISVKGFTTDEWLACVSDVMSINPLAVELNCSCPNVQEYAITNWKRIFGTAYQWGLEKGGIEVIVKVPPVGYEELVRQALDCGIDSFHCCNTLSTPGGGMSGKPLKTLSLHCVERVRKLTDGRIIGGGGITHLSDIDDYRKVGATNFSIATVLFNPFNWRRIRRMAMQLQP